MFIAAVTGRRSKWVILLAAIVVTVTLAPLAGKLAALENNTPTSFLPSGAPSTEVLRFQQEHGGVQSQPAFVVYDRQAGLTAADREVIAVARSKLADGRPSGVGAPTPVVVSQDGRAAFLSIPISGSLSATALDSEVTAIRSIVGETATPATTAGSSDGLRVAVGGPAGAAADATEAFAGIDTKLLAATVVIVAVLLLLIYRSPVLWMLPLISVGFAAVWSQAFSYLLARNGFVINGMTVGILTVLVFGAGTDYALLLVARYREELRRHDDHHAAMAVALRRAGPAIATSGLTVILGLLCLLLAQLNDVSALGPACAGAIACALVAQLVVLPALLLVLGRRVFWPFVPHPGDRGPEESGLFGRLGGYLLGRRRSVAVVLSLFLGACCLGLFAYRGGIDQANGFTVKTDSVEAQNVLTASFPALSGPTATVLVRPASATEAARSAAGATPGVTAVSPAAPLGPATTFQVSLRPGQSDASDEATVTALRRHLTDAAGSGVLVGGVTATNVDLAAAAAHDRQVIIPVVAAVVLVMLGLILRSVVAPVMLMATVLLSFFAALGVTALAARYVFGFAGFDPSVPIFGFVFLVALGVDYNIFLMSRVREEAAQGHTRGVLKGLAVTGSVITSAGVVLAATFAVLGVLPLVALAEVGFLVAFGVLIDTTLVRSALVPALALDIGPRLWWPSGLVAISREHDHFAGHNAGSRGEAP